MKKSRFLGMIFCAGFFVMSNTMAFAKETLKFDKEALKFDEETLKFDKEALKTEIFDLCEKYDVGFYYKNPNNMEELSYNSSKKYDPASTNKTYLALCVFEMIEKGEININEILEYKEHHKYGGTGLIQYGNFGEKYNIEQLLELLITQSDNVASRILRERVGEDNLKKFLSKIGTPVETEKCINQDFSAEDLVKHMESLFKFVQKGTDLSKKARKYFSEGIYNDKIPAGIPETVRGILHKPGWIPCKLICNDEAIIYDEDNEPYFLAIMSQNIPEEKQSGFFKELASKIHYYHCCCKKAHHRISPMSQI